MKKIINGVIEFVLTIWFISVLEVGSYYTLLYLLSWMGNEDSRIVIGIIGVPLIFINMAAGLVVSIRCMKYLKDEKEREKNHKRDITGLKVYD